MSAANNTAAARCKNDSKLLVLQLGGKRVNPDELTLVNDSGE
ncbi:hypothetical protein yrohd0001_30550 [Yersinia rohdei ATCC 43380]|nr:hypothetical protein yrohd0001_30550 [Yersinia rohdei ATCC 43380]